MAVEDLKRLSKEQQRFFVNRTELSGVQSINGSYEVSSRPLKYLGMRQSPIITEGNQVGNFNVNYLLITEDLFINFTGSSGFNGYLLKETGIAGNFSFTSGYLTNYSLKCGIGQIPEISAGITVFGNIGKFLSGESDIVSGDFQYNQTGITNTPLMISAPGSIDLNLSDFATNRVTSYELNINTPRIPVYALGRTTPIAVNIGYPIEITCDVQFEIFQYEPHNLQKFKCSPKTQDFDITLNTYDTNQEILNFSFTGMTLVGENYSTNVSDNVTVLAKYKTYILGN